MKKIQKIFINGPGSYDDFSGLWDDPDGADAEKEQRWASDLAEILLDIEVDMDTGAARIIRVNGEEIRRFQEDRIVGNLS